MELPQKEYFKIVEAAALLGVHPNSIRNVIKSGKLPAYRLGDKGHWRIKKTELEAFISEHGANL